MNIVYNTKRRSQVLLVSGEDRVMAGQPIAEGGVFLRAFGDVQIIAAADHPIADALLLNAVGVVVPHTDTSDATIDEDELFDFAVPKDIAISAAAATEHFDFDIGGVADVNVANFATPGLVNVNGLFDLNNWGRKVYGVEERLMTFAGTSDGFKDATPDTFIPNDRFPWGSRESVRCPVPSYALFAMGNPVMDQTVAVAHFTLQGREWAQLRWLDRSLDLAWPWLAGITEAGAESPFVDMADFVERLTEPVMLEETGGNFGAASFNVYSLMHLQSSSPGYDVEKFLTAEVGG